MLIFLGGVADHGCDDCPSGSRAIEAIEARSATIGIGVVALVAEPRSCRGTSVVTVLY